MDHIKINFYHFVLDQYNHIIKGKYSFIYFHLLFFSNSLLFVLDKILVVLPWSF